MFSPSVTTGRQLLPKDGRAILLNSKIAADEGFQVGDEIELTIGARESTWTVVGLNVSLINQQKENFVLFDALAPELGSVNRGASVRVATDRHDARTQEGVIDGLQEAFAAEEIEPAVIQETLIQDLRNVLTAHRIDPESFESAADLLSQFKGGYDVMTYLMLAMAILAALVGSIGLMSTMSINVVERRREIGVMRATGATSVNIAGIVVFEGVTVGVLSWLLAAPLSYPGGRAFSDVIGSTLMNIPLDYRYSIGGLLLWLLIVVVLSALASLWPALGATRVSVRESLAYE
jgi:putative ABC transport system permease protein